MYIVLILARALARLLRIFCTRRFIPNNRLVFTFVTLKLQELVHASATINTKAHLLPCMIYVLLNVKLTPKPQLFVLTLNV